MTDDIIERAIAYSRGRIGEARGPLPAPIPPSVWLEISQAYEPLKEALLSRAADRYSQLHLLLQMAALCARAASALSADIEKGFVVCYKWKNSPEVRTLMYPDDRLTGAREPIIFPLEWMAEMAAEEQREIYSLDTNKLSAWAARYP